MLLLFGAQQQLRSFEHKSLNIYHLLSALKDYKSIFHGKNDDNRHYDFADVFRM